MSEHFISDDDREYSRLNKKYIKLKSTNKQLLEALEMLVCFIESEDMRLLDMNKARLAITNAKQMGDKG